MKTAPPGLLPAPGMEPEALIREARRRQRRRWLAAGVAIALVAVGVAALIADSGAGGRPRSPGRYTAVRPRPAPSVMSGLPMPPGSSVRLLLTGPRPAWFWLATGRTEPIKGLPWNRFGYAFTRVVGGWSAQPYPAGPACLPTCAGPPSPVYFIADGSPRAARIASGFSVVASDGGGAVWLMTFRRSADDISTTPAYAQRVTTTGRPAGPRFRLPAGYLIQRAVGDDLLLAPVDDTGPVTYKLWEPATRRVARTFIDVIAASPGEIAWSPSCVRCPVYVRDLLTGTTATMPVPRQTWAVNDGTFSPDGRYLAFLLVTGVAPDGRAVRWRITVIDMSSRRLLAVPGTTISGDGAWTGRFGWQASGDRLIAVLPRSDGTIQVGSWQPEQAQLWVATARIPRGTYAVLGEYG